ncbi:hypothetical protein ALP50_100857 [Pseudomonas syringae pv. spinaceae]|uniref:Uncharacterized protein n=1 Tax=Pseudomonas syringae pv. spinaceae TaxID=264459 RepID=A0A0P9ZG55_PSESX|nr:Uncharacterized protein ALO94_05488 [Pseudomonas syringae pv. spinaceae]RMT27879.1 hypothetical protein ALP50_100857 [Pseudomonas syringae pv. spinaceae]
MLPTQRRQVLVEGFPTYTELTGQLGFRFPEAQLPDCDRLFVGQGLLASPVSSTLLDQDAFFGGLHCIGILKSLYIEQRHSTR